MKDLREQFHIFWAGRQAREKAFLIALVALVAIALAAQVLWASHQARARLEKQIPKLHQQVELLQRKAADLRQIRSQQPPPAPAEGSALLSATIAAANAARLPEAGSQLKLESSRRVRLHATLPFDQWLEWVAALQRDGQIRLVSCRVEAAGAPGQATIDALFALPEPG